MPLGLTPGACASLAVFFIPPELLYPITLSEPSIPKFEYIFLECYFVFFLFLSELCWVGSIGGRATVRIAQSCTPAVWGRGVIGIEYAFGSHLVMFILSTRCKVTLTGEQQ